MLDSKRSTLPVSVLTKILGSIFPVKALIYIGAGTGPSVGKRIKSWQAKNVLLIEANPHYRKELTKYVNQYSGWSSTSVLLGESETKMNFYHASNPQESGLLSPQELKTVWPNLKKESCEKLQQVTLNSLLERATYSQFTEDINCIVIDCIPALPILKGADNHLKSWDMLQIRVILNNELENIEGGHLEDIEAYLNPMGFHCVFVSESNHPAIGEAFFYKDWKQILLSKIQQQTNSSDRLTELVKEKEAQTQELTKSLDKRIELINLKDLQIQKMTLARANQLKFFNEKEIQIQELTQARDKQMELDKEKVEKIQLLTQELDTRRKSLEEYQVQITKVREDASEMSSVSDSHIKKLQQQLVSQEHRQHLLDDEFVKAEAQIELIKDILIREKAF